MTNYPVTIYLQIDDYDTGEQMDRLDWTHCTERIHNSDVAYHQVPDSVREAIRYLMTCDGNEHVGDGGASAAIHDLWLWLEEIDDDKS